MLSELGLPSRPLTEADLLAREPVPMFSDVGSFWRTNMPYAVKDSSGVVTYQNNMFTAALNRYVNFDERLGVSDWFDLSVLTVTTNDGHTIAPALQYTAPSNSSSTIYGGSEDSATIPVYSDASAPIYFFDSVSRVQVGTSIETFKEYGKRTNYPAASYTETFWNIKLTNMLSLMLTNKLINVNIHPLLDDIRSLSAITRIGTKSGASATSRVVASYANQTKSDTRYQQGPGE
jgi:hypothetical protein